MSDTIVCMSSDTPPGGFKPDPSRSSGSPQSAGSGPSAPSSPPPPRDFGRPVRWLAFTASAVALISLTVGIVGWFRPAPHHDQPPPKPSYTEQQTADAKAKVCDAFGKLDRATGVLNTLAKNSDRNFIIINTRQVFDVFSRYLTKKLSENPATPADLATAVRQQADSLEEVLIGYEDGYTNDVPEVQPSVKVNNSTATAIREMCK